MIRSNSAWAIVSAFVIAVVIGCGSSDGRRAVSGTVTLQGKPLDQGTIDFYPAGQPSPPVGALISEGKYDIPAKQGLLPGKYLVKIQSPEAFPITPEEYAAGKTAPPAKERIPAKYNDESAETVEVKASGVNQFDYRID